MINISKNPSKRQSYLTKQIRLRNKYETNSNVNNYSIIAYGFQNNLDTSEDFYRMVSSMMISAYQVKGQPLVVLDNGCGVGRFIYDMSEHYPNATFHGIDFSIAMVERANGMLCKGQKFELRNDLLDMPFFIKGKHCKNVSVEKGDARKLDFPKNSFDYINSTNLIDRVPDALEVILEMIRVLKPGGKIMITSPLDFKGFPDAINYTFEQVKEMLEANGINVEFVHEGFEYQEFGKPIKVWKTCLIYGTKKHGGGAGEKISIIPIEDLNIQSIADIYKTVFEYKPWNEKWTLDEVEQIIREAKGFETFNGKGILINDKLVGFAYGFHLLEKEKFERILEFLPNINHNDLFYLSEFGIHPFYQNQRLGKKLMESISKELPLLVVRTKNKHMVSVLESFYSKVVELTHDFIEPCEGRSWYLCYR